MNKDKLETLLTTMKELLERDLNYKICPICGDYIVRYENVWQWQGRHLPYFSLEEGRIKVGYLCPKSIKEPIIIYDISLKDLE